MRDDPKMNLQKKSCSAALTSGVVEAVKKDGELFEVLEAFEVCFDDLVAFFVGHATH